jgi:hypothetical protein
MRPEHRDRQATLPTGVSWLSEVTNLPVTNADDNSLCERRGCYYCARRGGGVGSTCCCARRDGNEEKKVILL